MGAKTQPRAISVNVNFGNGIVTCEGFNRSQLQITEVWFDPEQKASASERFHTL